MMRPKLKEEPVEWVKFTAVWLVVSGIAIFGLWWRRHISLRLFVSLLVLLALILALSLCRPRWFRKPYRAGMTISFFIGQAVGRVLLAGIFLFVLTPLGLFLRLMGKDLLGLKRPGVASYWHPVKKESRLDSQF